MRGFGQVDLSQVTGPGGVVVTTSGYTTAPAPAAGTDLYETYVQQMLSSPAFQESVTAVPNYANPEIPAILGGPTGPLTGSSGGGTAVTATVPWGMLAAVAFGLILFSAFVGRK